MAARYGPTAARVRAQPCISPCRGPLPAPRRGRHSKTVTAVRNEVLFGRPAAATRLESVMTTQGNKDAKLRLLLVEDSTADAELAIRRLQQAGYECSFERVVDEVQMRAALGAGLPDIILSDFSLPQFDGIAALAIARELAPDVPFIFLSGTIGEERAIEALKSGAIDYVLKTNPKRLVPAVKRALEDSALRRKSRLAEQRVARLSRVVQMISTINSALVRIQSREEV